MALLKGSLLVVISALAASERLHSRIVPMHSRPADLAHVNTPLVAPTAAEDGYVGMPFIERAQPVLDGIRNALEKAEPSVGAWHLDDFLGGILAREELEEDNTAQIGLWFSEAGPDQWSFSFLSSDKEPLKCVATFRGDTFVIGGFFPVYDDAGQFQGVKSIDESLSTGETEMATFRFEFPEVVDPPVIKVKIDMAETDQLPRRKVEVVARRYSESISFAQSASLPGYTISARKDDVAGRIETNVDGTTKASEGKTKVKAKSETIQTEVTGSSTNDEVTAVSTAAQTQPAESPSTNIEGKTKKATRPSKFDVSPVKKLKGKWLSRDGPDQWYFAFEYSAEEPLTLYAIHHGDTYIVKGWTPTYDDKGDFEGVVSGAEAFNSRGVAKASFSFKLNEKANPPILTATVQFAESFDGSPSRTEEVIARLVPQ